MKRLAVLSALVLLGLLVVAATPSTAQHPIGIKYDWEGEFGELTVLNAAGRHMFVVDAIGAPVLAVVIRGEDFTCGIPNRGRDPEGAVVRVFLDGPTYFQVDRDDDWYWE